MKKLITTLSLIVLFTTIKSQNIQNFSYEWLIKSQRLKIDFTLAPFTSAGLQGNVFIVRNKNGLPFDSVDLVQVQYVSDGPKTITFEGNFDDTLYLVNFDFYEIPGVSPAFFEFQSVRLPDSTVGINSVYSDPLVQIYPQPASRSMTIEMPEEGTLSVMDMTGKKVLEEPIVSGTNIIQTTSLATGMYSCIIQTQKGIVSKKLVVSQ